MCFNPRIYIRYDIHLNKIRIAMYSFNPRTYIRYDSMINNVDIYSVLNMLLCETLFTILFLYGGAKGKAYNMLKIRNSGHPCISVTTSGSQRLKLLIHPLHYKT